jgi:hypothetical protein
MSAPISPEPSQSIAFVQTLSSRRWTLHLLEPSGAGQVCQDAFVQGASRVAVYYPSFSLRIYAKLTPKANAGSSMKWSPGYGFLGVFKAEAK